MFKKLGSLNAPISRFHPDIEQDDMVQLELDPEESEEKMMVMLNQRFVLIVKKNSERRDL